MTATSPARCELFDEIAYTYDGSLEGLLSAIFAAYARHERPTDIEPEDRLVPRLGQHVSHIETNLGHAERVRIGIQRVCGPKGFNAVRYASVSSDAHAGTAVYRFVRYAMDAHHKADCRTCRKRETCKSAHSSGRPRGYCPRQGGSALSDVTHPDVEPLFRLRRSVSQECEHMRQFIRFQHLQDERVNVWFAVCNPRDAVVPLIMDHFVERFNVQPFMIYDENHGIVGIYEGHDWYLVRVAEFDDPIQQLPDHAREETLMQEAWKGFYRTVAVESRYNPELRRHFMPKRFWKNLTEMQEMTPALMK